MPRARGPGHLPLDPPASLPARLRAVAGARSLVYAPGATIVRLGAPVRSVLAIEAGAVVVRLHPPSGAAAFTQILGPGDLLGLGALRQARRRGRGARGRTRVEAQALVRTSLISAPGPEVRRAIAMDPWLTSLLLEAVAEHVARLERSIAATVGTRLSQRTLAALMKLAISHGKPIPGGDRIDLPLSQDLLASMVGGARESVNRTLQELAASGAIRREGRSYVVPVSDRSGKGARLGQDPPG